VHRLVRRFLKTGIFFLGVGLLLGAWMLVRRELWGIYPTTYLMSAHTHAILVGFVMMMILGIALWMFPRPAREDVRYRPELAAAAYWLVTAGTATRLAGEIARSGMDGMPLRVLVVAGGLAQVAGIGLFFATMWTRIRATGSAAREERGERF
jgi:heme/copper-type cytochrome/quinol oxidase subunit 1